MIQMHESVLTILDDLNRNCRIKESSEYQENKEST